MFTADREDAVFNHTSSSGASHAEVVACSVVPIKDEGNCNAQLRAEERALRLRLKNNTAQKRFRERCKQKLDVLREKEASLQQQLQDALRAKAALEQETNRLQEHVEAVARNRSDWSRDTGEADPPIDPASGIAGFTPMSRGGILLRELYGRRLSHDELMRLTVADHIQIGKTMALKAGELLLLTKEEDLQCPAGRRLRLLMKEHSCLRAHLASWRPGLFYRIFLRQMDGIAQAPLPPHGLDTKQLARLNFTDNQKQYLCQCHNAYVADLNRILSERRRLQQLLQGVSEGMQLQAHEVECMRAHKMQMVKWKQIARAFRQNLELGFSRECVLMGTVNDTGLPSCTVTPFQKARLMLDAYPAHVDFFQLLHLLAASHDHQEECSKPSASEAAELQCVQESYLPDPLTEDPSQHMLTVQDRIMSFVLTSKCPIDLALSVPVKQEDA